MNPYRPANLTSETTPRIAPSTRLPGITLLAFASTCVGIVVLAALFSESLQSFFKPRFGTEAPIALLLPIACLWTWWRKPTLRRLALATLAFFLVATIFYFRTVAHVTLWGTVGSVVSPRNDRLDSSFTWCVAPLVACGSYLTICLARLCAALARHHSAEPSA